MGKEIEGRLCLIRAMTHEPGPPDLCPLWSYGGVKCSGTSRSGCEEKCLCNVFLENAAGEERDGIHSPSTSLNHAYS